MTNPAILRLCAEHSDGSGINVAGLALATGLSQTTVLSLLFCTTKEGMTAAHPVEGEDIPLYTLTHYGRYRAGLPVVEGARKPQEAK